jgi:3-phenylpropionate/cinnamic acid dioxygenase small subunit
MPTHIMDIPLDATSGLREVRRLLAALEADRFTVDAAGQAEADLVAQASLVISHEARLLDAQRFDDWLQLWEPDAVLWVPLAPEYASNDQSLFLDDLRRLHERIAWRRDPAAWGVQPSPSTVRGIGSVEAWPAGSAEVLVSSTLQVQQTSRAGSWSTSGRQIHRLRSRDGAWRLVRKTLLLPELLIGTPNLGWLL